MFIIGFFLCMTDWSGGEKGLEVSLWRSQLHRKSFQIKTNVTNLRKWDFVTQVKRLHVSGIILFCVGHKMFLRIEDW